VVQADGQLKTGRDVIIAALLGAEEFGFAAPRWSCRGAIMMRVCHPGHLPVGVATQNPELRARFSGKPEFVVNFFEFIAEEVREYLARLGFRTLEEIIGRADLLDTVEAVDTGRPPAGSLAHPLHPAAARGSRTELRHPPGSRAGRRRWTTRSSSSLRGRSRKAARSTLTCPIRNVNRTVGTMLGYEVTRRWAARGCPRTRSTCRSAAQPASRSALPAAAASRCGWRATPTTTWQGPIPAAG